MISGKHAHFCPTCKENKECAQITHCCRAAVAVCDNCRAAEFAKQESGFIEGRTEETYYQTGKWPKE